jgi:putative peptide-modifying radical SAM enzyme
MDILEGKFIIQTNGILVRSLPDKYWKRMDAILLSIDGRRAITDGYRGRGTYGKVLLAANYVRSAGFKGDLIARMAVSEKMDIFKEVTHLENLKKFDHIHWQLDVGWSDSWVDFDAWCNQCYKPGIEKLAEKWKAAIEDSQVLGYVPFLGILKRLRNGGPSPPCGSGSESIAIMPDGQIRACPISFDADWAKIGFLGKDTLNTLKKVQIGAECRICDLFNGCGGRCLYFNKEHFWGPEGFTKVCELTKFTINVVKSLIKPASEAVSLGRISFNDLDYPKYNNSTEIIP